MASQTSKGIQTLLDAEKDAAKVVQEARTYRTQKLKDARTEAQKDIEAYKTQKDADFKKFEGSHAGETKTKQVEIDKDTDQKLGTLQGSYQQNKDEVVKKLLDRVLLVKPQLHPNLKKL